MSRVGWGGLLSGAYLLLFFAFLFGPLVIMVATAFNSSPFPRIVPWECFTTDWFGVLVRNDRLMGGLATSAVIGVGVVALSVPVGLAGALMLAEVGPRLRSSLYTVLIAPILIPGVVLGISTIVFWGHVARLLGLGYDSPLYNGGFLTLLGQVSFIASYAMLIFMARLQRFDTTLTEAALDLGATPGQAFRKILLPFLRPAIASAAFLTLLASFENYNTTVFTILSGNTFTTALASKVRLGTDPSLSALAVIIIAATLVIAVVREAHARRRDIAMGRRPATGLDGHPVARLMTHPASVGVLLVAAIGVAILAGRAHDASACREDVLREKRAIQERLLQEQREQLRRQAPAAPEAPAGPAPGNPSPFGGAFRPGGIAPPSPVPPSPVPPSPAPASPATPQTPAGPAPGNPSPFGGAFRPGTLGPPATAPAAPPPPPASPAPNAAPVAPPAGTAPGNPSPFGGAFRPDTLGPPR